MTERVEHEFLPVFDQDCRVLVLGTMPSPKSREEGFYYGHPRNRFWPLMAEVLQEPCPKTTEEKTRMLLQHHIALWDVLKSCEIHGAEDTSIRNPEPNDMGIILSCARIQAVFATGTKAASLFKKLCTPVTGISAITLPSTSPANCRISWEELIREYGRILEYL